MKRFDISKENIREYGNIKRQLTTVINELRSSGQNSNNLKILLKVRERVNACSHCDGETDDSGTCLEAFSIA